MPKTPYENCLYSCWVVNAPNKATVRNHGLSLDTHIKQDLAFAF